MSTASPSALSTPAPLSQQAITQLKQRRGSFGYGLTNVARAIDKGPFVHGLRRWVVPSVLLSSAAWVVGASLNAPTAEERKRRFTKYGMGALGTIGAAIYGFKYILKPAPNTAGKLGQLALKHLGELLPAAQRAKLPKQGEELLEAKLSQLGLGDKYPKWADEELGHVLEEELTQASDVLDVLEHLKLPLGEFKQRLTHWAKQAEATGEKGLNPKDVQIFRNELLGHVFKQHGVAMENPTKQALARMKSRLLNVGAVRQARQGLEDALHQFTGFKDDIAEAAQALVKEGKSPLKASKKAHSEQATKLLNAVVDGPGGISSADMKEEIWDLSKMGLLPVVGGVAGGALGDAIAGENWRQTIKAKGKEGLFQYLANIMLCNVGAMAFIGATEKIHENNTFGLGKWAGKYATRVGAMTAGILAIGVLGGSFIANFLGENILNPLIDGGPGGMARHLKERVQEDGPLGLFKKLYAHRVPEPLDVMLHVDDFATGAAISGLAFVEPFLALFYTLSGIRAGMGYRNRKPDEPPEANANRRLPEGVNQQPALATVPVTGARMAKAVLPVLRTPAVKALTSQTTLPVTQIATTVQQSMGGQLKPAAVAANPFANQAMGRVALDDTLSAGTPTGRQWQRYTRWQ